MILNNRLILGVDDGKGPISVFKDSGIKKLDFILHPVITCTIEDTLEVIRVHNPGVILMDFDLDSTEFNGLTIWNAVRVSGYSGIILPNSGMGWLSFKRELIKSDYTLSDPDMCEEMDVFKKGKYLREVIKKLIAEGRL